MPADADWQCWWTDLFVRRHGVLKSIPKLHQLLSVQVLLLFDALELWYQGLNVGLKPSYGLQALLMKASKEKETQNENSLQLCQRYFCKVNSDPPPPPPLSLSLLLTLSRLYNTPLNATATPHPFLSWYHSLLWGTVNYNK